MDAVNQSNPQHGDNNLAATLNHLVTAFQDVQKSIEEIKTTIAINTSNMHELIKKEVNQAILTINPPHSPTEIKSIVREHILELRERDKRVDFIVVRGVEFNENFQQSFNEITNHILQRNVPLTDITPIRPSLVRARLSDRKVKSHCLFLLTFFFSTITSFPADVDPL